MPRKLLPALALAAALPALSVAADEPAPIETMESKYSYGLGLSIAQTLQQQGINEGLDIDAFVLGIADYLNGADPRVSLDEVQQAFAEMQAKREAEAKARAAAALEAGQAFLAQHASAEGVQVTESGIQYIVVEAGEGDSPTPENQVKVHYEGKLLDGSIFDSSYARGVPAEFGVTQVIAGWQEILQLMKPGAIWDVWIPSGLAYGERGAGEDIGPNEVLNFRIELIEIVEG